MEKKRNLSRSHYPTTNTGIQIQTPTTENMIHETD